MLRPKTIGPAFQHITPKKTNKNRWPNTMVNVRYLPTKVNDSSQILIIVPSIYLPLNAIVEDWSTKIIKLDLPSLHQPFRTPPSRLSAGTTRAATKRDNSRRAEMMKDHASRVAMGKPLGVPNRHGGKPSDQWIGGKIDTRKPHIHSYFTGKSLVSG